jgi:hypothetical protein
MKKLFSLAVVLLASMTARANQVPLTVVESIGPATLAASGKVSQGQISIRLSDTLILTWTVEGPETLEVEFASPLVVADGWHIGTDEGVTISNTNKGRRWSRTLRLDAWTPGQSIIKPAHLKLREKPGDWQTIKWKPIPVTITTEIRQADLNELRDITDIERLPTLPADSGWWILVVGGSVVGAIVALAYVSWWRRRSKWKRSLTAEEWANRELARVLALKLPEVGDFDRFHTMLSNVVRRYLENCFQVPARRRTTPEFLRFMEGSPYLADTEKAMLKQFLERCDLAKFAGLKPTIEECRQAAEMARTLITRESRKSRAEQAEHKL